MYVSLLPENEVVADVVAEILVGLHAAATVAPESGGGSGGAGGRVAPLERLVVRAGWQTNRVFLNAKKLLPKWSQKD